MRRCLAPATAPPQRRRSSAAAASPRRLWHTYRYRRAAIRGNDFYVPPRSAFLRRARGPEDGATNHGGGSPRTHALPNALVHCHCGDCDRLRAWWLRALRPMRTPPPPFSLSLASASISRIARGSGMLKKNTLTYSTLYHCSRFPPSPFLPFIYRGAPPGRRAALQLSKEQRDESFRHGCEDMAVRVWGLAGPKCTTMALGKIRGRPS
eukprot:scaffold14672_cov145-Isochrysis_galbana.AAC.2